IRRGIAEEELKVTIEGAPDDQSLVEGLERTFGAAACTVPDSPGADVLRDVARTALREHVLPSIENELHKALRQVADDVAIEVFAENVGKVLLAAPFGAKAVVGIDPGIRTGCKAAAIDASGNCLRHAVLRLANDEQRAAARETLRELVRDFSADA